MTNRLANETSPYLQQHAGNPVDWFPWGEEALELARRNDRPILLSVGYSACHWCHVMAHESFEDDEIAALMNRWFVNVKVDREERPDIDQIYQLAHQLIARRPGGWPLTMFLTPQGKPFYGGTYFPKQARFDLPGFGELLQRVAHVWQTQRAQVDAQGDELVRYLQETLPRRDGGGLPEDDEGAPQEADGELKEADGESRRPAGEPPATLESTARRAARGLREALMREFDATHGGFGGAPKFPQPASLDALLRHAVDARDEVARDAVLLTLRRMAEGGLYDHLGGGFCRYSTDARWTIPHFEKMLYDNGPLLRLYAEAWQLTREPLFREVCEETAAWTMREMQSPAGGYYSSIDADSEGEEGRFYVWQRDEVAAALDDADFAAFAARYGLAAPANFEGHAWHLHVAASMDEVAASAQLAPQELGARIGGARARLFAIREARVKPGRDEKILTSWNALAIDGMAFAGRVFDRPLWQASARAALAFLRDALWRDGRLLATHKDGRSHLNAYLDDYAFLLGAVLEVAQGEALRADDLEFARALADALLDRFEDAREGGFFFTSHDHEALVMRPKSAYDSAMPSGNGVAALHLQRLGHLTGELRYLEAARRTLELFASDARRVPHGMATLVVAMSEYATPPTVAVLTGPPEPLADWRRELVRDYRPSTMVVDLGDGPGSWPQALAKPAGASPQAWVCRATHCLPPIGELEALRTALGDRVAGA